ncbi:potassium channel family protein [Paraburkholderia unamae]|uniref:Potassium channel family protein n=1 Tax=Paraburkholderia unamae TaxID=219649 RepID=A0ACC6RNL7_9BURK
MKNASNSAHTTLLARCVVAEFPKALWQLRAPIAFLFALYFALAVVMYHFGGPVESASGLPCSFGEALYLCAMRAITIGYSGIVPTTSVGHIVSGSLGVLGILLVGSVAAAALRGVDEAIQRAGTRR